MTITTLIRFHDLSQIERLGNCLFSLECQKVKPALVLILVQLVEGRVNDLQKLEKLVQTFDLNTSIRCFNLPSGKHDIRAQLLNSGIDLARTEMIHILDFDDIMFEDAYLLAEETAQSDGYSSLIYFFRVKRCYVDTKVGPDYACMIDSPWLGRGKQELLVDNFCPIHSYFINKGLAAEQQLNLFFDESYDALEDYNFLLRYSDSKYNFSQIDKFIGLYNFRNDGLNTTVTDAISPSSDSTSTISERAKALMWENGKLKIDELKKRLGLN